MPPNRLAGTQEAVCSLAREISTDICLNVMVQYHPCYEVFDIPQLVRAVNRQGLLEAIDLAYRQGLYRLDRDYTSLPLSSS
ncbi:hypothetical protein ACFLX8_00020 [Chloroflexota bacterium]